MLPSTILDAVQICTQLGVNRVVLSPGSRSAPLTLAFARHPQVTTYVIGDERSAAFIGLGMAQQLRQPIALVCTSGSASYNYAPAVAEAFFQQIPLIIFTADRPPEWIDQLDGQTIRQRGIYGTHVKASYELPVGPTKADAWYSGRIVSEALSLSQQEPPGPVHINVPIREPFYPTTNEVVEFNESVKVIRTTPGQRSLSDQDVQTLADEWARYEKKLIVGGQGRLDTDLIEVLRSLCVPQQVPIVADVISNLHPIASAVRHADVLLAQPQTDLVPDLLITFGRSVISKNLKLFLRKHPPVAHWHIQPAGTAADTFQSLTRVIHSESTTFFRQLLSHLPSSIGPATTNYFDRWQQKEEAARQRVDTLFTALPEVPLGEFQAVQTVLQQLPDHVNLHLANSMSVRYANLIGLAPQQGTTEVFANRGTSGIDGSSSTAVGSALTSDRLTVLITGDMAFFYDRNAFWHRYPLPNLRIILLNNHGGGIFRLIKGPSQQPELEEYFETHQTLTAERTAQDFDMEYQLIDLTERDDLSSLERNLFNFYDRVGDRPKLLEVVTNQHNNHKVWAHYHRMVVNS